MAFNNRWEQKFNPRQVYRFKRGATINGRPAYVVVAERNAKK